MEEKAKGERGGVWWENGIRARLKGAGWRWGGGGGGGWRAGGSWKDEGECGRIIGAGANARVGIGDRRRQGRWEEGWAEAETSGWAATLLRPRLLRGYVMDDMFFSFSSSGLS